MFQLDEIKAREFLLKAGIQNYEIKKVAGDASFRSYYRIFYNEKNIAKTYILMFAPPQYEDIIPFIKIDKWLFENNFSAPEIFLIDESLGFILLEDFGDATYGRVLANVENEKKKILELDLYKKACDSLVELHKIKNMQELPAYNNAVLFREVMLLIDWYLPLQNKNITLEQKAFFKSLWFKLFDMLSKENQVVVLRDFHADNLMTLPNRKSFHQVGLLDFQDALIGSKAYDLVSLLEDARRDLNEENRQVLFNYYLEKSGCDKLQFITDYEILSLQRNIKIVGIFSRLAMRDGKKQYLDLLPRVLNFVHSRLDSQNPIFLDIANLLKKFI